MTHGAANVHPLDEHRDPGRVALVRDVAATVAAAFGSDLVRMRRVNGYSNSTWVGGGLAVRIADGDVDLAREAALIEALPHEAGHPPLLGTGTTDGFSWTVTVEVPGRNLHEVWPTLSPEQRQQAIRQLWARVQAVHDATDSLATLVDSHRGFVPTAGDAMKTARRVGSAIALSAAQQARLQELVEGFYRAASAVDHVVNHGDLALMNALWDGEVLAVLDFEFAVLGPAEIDLCRLVCEALVSDDGQRTDPQTGHVAVQIAANRMDPVHGHALLHGAAVLDQLRDLNIGVVQHSATESALDRRALHLLAGLLDSDCGYLVPLLG